MKKILAQDMGNLSKRDLLHTIISTIDTSEMLVASLGDFSTIMIVSNDTYVGLVDASHNEPKYGSSPIVYLKHDVKLQKNSDGSYIIIDSW